MDSISLASSPSPTQCTLHCTLFFFIFFDFHHHLAAICNWKLSFVWIFNIPRNHSWLLLFIYCVYVIFFSEMHVNCALGYLSYFFFLYIQQQFFFHRFAQCCVKNGRLTQSPCTDTPHDISTTHKIIPYFQMCIWQKKFSLSLSWPLIFEFRLRFWIYFFFSIKRITSAQNDFSLNRYYIS